MLFIEICDRVEQAVQDTSLTTDDQLLSLANEAVLRICRSYHLPEIIKSYVLDILSIEEFEDAASGDREGTISLPDDYLHSLYRVINLTTGDPVNIRTANKFLLLLESDRSGYTTDVAVTNTTLAYTPQCESHQQLELWYYGCPVAMTGLATDEPISIPSFLHQRLIVGYMIKEFFTLIEDGAEGQKVNTMHWNQEYAAGLHELDLYCRKSPRQTPIITRSARYF